jgi:hypothetical protein
MVHSFGLPPELLCVSQNECSVYASSQQPRNTRSVRRPERYVAAQGRRKLALIGELSRLPLTTRRLEASKNRPTSKHVSCTFRKSHTARAAARAPTPRDKQHDGGHHTKRSRSGAAGEKPDLPHRLASTTKLHPALGHQTRIVRNAPASQRVHDTRHAKLGLMPRPNLIVRPVSVPVPVHAPP